MLKSKKIVLVGHFGVGKSSLIRRYVQNVFSDDYFVTIGVHIIKKVVVVNKQELTLLIWDIEGKEDIKKLRPSFLLGTSGFIYVLDAGRPTTYENLADELNFIKTNYPKSELVTVANKIDLVDKDSFIMNLGEKASWITHFTSAKTGECVELLFEKLAHALVQQN